MKKLKFKSNYFFFPTIMYYDIRILNMYINSTSERVLYIILYNYIYNNFYLTFYERLLIITVIKFYLYIKK